MKQAAASRRHYLNNSEVIKQRAVAYRKACRERNKEYVNSLKRDAVCTDCKIDYPFYILQFDHIGDDKKDHVSTMANSGVPLSTLRAEIAKCEIVCANCHITRTYTRAKWRGGDLNP